MLILSTKNYGLKTDRVAVIYHPKLTELEDKINNYRKSFIKAQFIKAGESILTAGRWNYFDSVVVYPSKEVNTIDYLQRLAIYKDAFKMLKNSKKTELVFIGSSINLLADKLLYIPKSHRVFINDRAKSFDIDVSTNGLNLINTWYDGGTAGNMITDRYKVLEYLSNNRNIKLLGYDSTVKYGDSISAGSLLKLYKGRLTNLTSEDYKSQFKESKDD